MHEDIDSCPDDADARQVNLRFGGGQNVRIHVNDCRRLGVRLILVFVSCKC